MADMLVDGLVKVTYTPTIVSIAAPAAATELESGSSIDLECLITADGFDISVDEATISIPKLCETFDAEAPGRAKYGLTFTFVRQDTTLADKAWEGLPRLTAGYIAVRLGVAASTTWAAAHKALVFPVKAGEQRPQKPEPNGAVLFQQQWYVTSQPNLHAVCAA